MSLLRLSRAGGLSYELYEPDYEVEGFCVPHLVLNYTASDGIITGTVLRSAHFYLLWAQTGDQLAEWLDAADTQIDFPSWRSRFVVQEHDRQIRAD